MFYVLVTAAHGDLIPKTICAIKEDVEREGVCVEFDENSLVQSKHLAEAIESACNFYSVEFIDAAGYAEASLVDCLHMDAENHQKLANAIYEKIASMEISV